MKKLSFVLALSLALVLALAGCGGKTAETNLVDGTYRAEMSDDYAASEGHGWKGYVVLTVADGSISDVDFDYINEDCALKSEQSEEEYPMTPHPKEWIPQLEASGKKAASPEDLDAITDATSSSAEFKELYTAALEAATSGQSETIVLH